MRCPAIRARSFFAAAVLALSAAPSAGAQESPDDLTVMGWSLSNVRAGMRVGPDYMGSDDYRFTPSGSVAIYRRGTQPSYGAPDDGFSLGLVGNRKVSAGLSGRWRSGRDNEDDLRGFEKIDWAVEAGAFVNLWPADWIRLRGELRRGFNGHEGWVADLGADFIARQGSWAVSAGPRLTFGDEEFTRTYFRVLPLEAQRSPFGITPYTPDDGSSAAGLVASAEYRASRRWSVAVFANWRRLSSEAADSPIVADLGSRDQFSATLGLRYWFGR